MNKISSKEPLSLLTEFTQGGLAILVSNTHMFTSNTHIYSEWQEFGLQMPSTNMKHPSAFYTAGILCFHTEPGSVQAGNYLPDV